MKKLGFIIFVLAVIFITYKDVYTWMEHKGIAPQRAEPAPQQGHGSIWIDLNPMAESDEAREDPQWKIPRYKKKYTQYPNGRAELFTRIECYWCDKTRKFLQDRGVTIIEYDIATNKTARQRMKSLAKNHGVPVVIINGRLILNYSERAFIEALEQNN